jgi:hypothetical protein
MHRRLPILPIGVTVTRSGVDELQRAKNKTKSSVRAKDVEKRGAVETTTDGKGQGVTVADSIAPKAKSKTPRK